MQLESDINCFKSVKYLGVYIHCLKNQYTWRLIITSANVDRFPKFFYCQFPKEILYVTIAGQYGASDVQK